MRKQYGPFRGRGGGGEIPAVPTHPERGRLNSFRKEAVPKGKGTGICLAVGSTGTGTLTQPEGKRESDACLTKRNHGPALGGKGKSLAPNSFRKKKRKEKCHLLFWDRKKNTRV